MRFAVAIIILVFSLGSASAQPRWAAGVGVTQCSHFLELIKQNPPLEDVFFSWAQGYLSAMNAEIVSANQVNLLGKSAEEQKAFLRGFCEKQPLAPYGRAVIDLIIALPPLGPDTEEQEVKKG